MSPGDGAFDGLAWGGGAHRIVLVHGSASGPRALAPLGEQLAADDRQVLAPALQGYGRVARPPVGDDPGGLVAANATALRALVNGHDGGPVTVFGHSMGGLVALRAALAGARIARLVLYEPIALAVLDARAPSDGAPSDGALRDWDRAVVAELARAVADGEPERGVAAFVTAWNGSNWTVLPAALRARLVAMAAHLAAEVRATSFATLDRAGLATLGVPIHILHGTSSPPLAQRICARLASSVPYATCQTLAGLGHMGPVTAPAVLADHIDRFLRPAGSQHCV